MIRSTSLIVAILLLGCSLLFGATIRVPSEQPTIQAAVDIAGQDDTVLVEAGTYSGAGFEGIFITGKSLVLRSEAGAENTILQTTGTERTIVVSDSDSQSVTIEGFTISGGYESDFDSSYAMRGGISADAGTLIFRNCVVSGCYNGSGGGVKLNASVTGVIEDCDISYNHCQYGGGGIFARGQSISVIGTRLYSNQAWYGGGISSRADSTTISGCYIARNRISYGLDDIGMGGGIVLELSSYARVDSCIISQNRGTRYAGILCGALEAWITNNVFYNNVAVAISALMVEATDSTYAVVDHNTFVCNYSMQNFSDGIFVTPPLVIPSPPQASPESDAHPHAPSAHALPGVTVTNNLLAFNSHAAIRQQSYDVPVAITNNNVWHSVSGVNYAGLIDDLTGTDGNISADPLFCEMSDSGLTLDASSPCVGAGTDGSTIGAKGVGCDMYGGEQPRSVTVSGTDEKQALPQDLTDSLLSAIATARPWDTVTFASQNFISIPNLVIDKPIYLLAESPWGPYLETEHSDTAVGVDAKTFCVVRGLGVFVDDWSGGSRAIRCSGGSPIITECTGFVLTPLNESGGTNVLITGGSPYLTHCNIESDFAVLSMAVTDSADVMAPYNYWGDDLQIMDGRSHPGLGIIRYDPKLNDTPTDVQSDYEPGLPENFALSQNYPNPFNPSTTIEFDLPQRADVSLVVYNILGRKVATLVNGSLGAGHHTIVWDGTTDGSAELATGVYLYKLTAGDFVETRKMVLVK